MASDDRLPDLLNTPGPAPSSSWIASGDIDEEKARAITSESAKENERLLADLVAEELRKAEEQD
jgi:hypothetical protein